MSDLEDWECEEAEEETTQTATKFVEEEVDSDDEEKKKKEVNKKAAEEAKNRPKVEKAIPMTEYERRALKNSEKARAEKQAQSGKSDKEI